MERAIIHSDLTKKEIQPQLLIERYIEQLSLDITQMLPNEYLHESFCPVTGEEAVRYSFEKMGMQYNVSQTFGNIYLSPRPSTETLRRFYQDSPARKFWITELWPQTKEARQEKIILPQLEWAKGFISQFYGGEKLFLSEYLSNHWGYYDSAKELFTGSDYTLIEPLFDSKFVSDDVQNSVMTSELSYSSMDAAFLFEALDRSIAPFDLLQKVFNYLKSGGLCFITSLLSSGFEVQVLGKTSEIFVPPERMNLLSYEGMNAMIEKMNGFEILEFSTPSVLDIPNVITQLSDTNNSKFFNYIFTERQDPELLSSFQDYLQMNRLGTFARLVLRKQ